MGPPGSLKSISNYPPSPIQLQRSKSTAVPRLVAEVRPTTLVGGAKYGATGQSKGHLQLSTFSNPTPMPEAEATWATTTRTMGKRCGMTYLEMDDKQYPGNRASLETQV